jgi:hypothetical protein
VVSDHERRARSEPTVHLGDGSAALSLRDEMQRQEAGRAIEGAGRTRVNVALSHLDAARQRTERLAGQGQHLGRRIDTAEAPARIGFGERLEFESPASAEHKHIAIRRHMFGE